MTSYERIKRTFEHKETDRIPICDSPWAGTLRRWHNEGMPDGVAYEDYFDLDKIAHIGVDITPRYEQKVLEENERWQIVTTNWGVTMKNFKEEDSTPEFLDFKVNTPKAWEEAKARMTHTADRIDWSYLQANYDRWRSEGQWIQAEFWFGFDVAHSWMAGTEDFLCALLTEPDWVKDVFNTYLDSCIALFEQIYNKGYRFDSVKWPDDMGYKDTTFFSPDLYRELLQPIQKRAVEWAHNHGAYAHLHSCGNIMSLLPDITATGIDALNPLEVKAGMDCKVIKETYGKSLVLHGGVNAALWDQPEALFTHMEEQLPVLAKDGGYIFASDHSIPNSVTLDTFRKIVERVKAQKP